MDTNSTPGHLKITAYVALFSRNHEMESCQSDLIINQRIWPTMGMRPTKCLAVNVCILMVWTGASRTTLGNAWIFTWFDSSSFLFPHQKSPDYGVIINLKSIIFSSACRSEGSLLYLDFVTRVRDPVSWSVTTVPTCFLFRLPFQSLSFALSLHWMSVSPFTFLWT